MRQKVTPSIPRKEAAKRAAVRKMIKRLPRLAQCLAHIGLKEVVECGELVGDGTRSCLDSTHSEAELRGVHATLKRVGLCLPEHWMSLLASV